MSPAILTRRTIHALLALFLCAAAAMPARAALIIDIVGAGDKQIPIAIAPFRDEAGLPQQLTSVIAADLARSGLFKTVDPGGIVPMPSEPDQVNYPQWKARGAEALVIGNVTQRDKLYEVSFRLMDVVKGTQLAGFLYRVEAPQLRLTAHKIADAIYEKLTGAPGVFATKITYVVKRGKVYELQVSDADGFGAQTILKSDEPIISPSWAPDGNRLAYVSFERKKPVVYVQSLRTGARNAVANFSGSNSAPAWSPDGRRLAVTLTKDGGSQIFSIPADGGAATRLTHSGGIDTEANWSPDGQWIIFTSDRGGGPQIYRMPSSGGQAQRLTFEGNYNVSPRHSPDGKTFTFVQQRQGGRFSVAVQDFATRQMELLTEGGVDESPSYAPNGRMILYASEVKGRGILAAVSSDGRVKQRFSEGGGDVREPAWGPLIK